ncbi:Large ribosomal subunit mL38-like protein [Cladobotryum mycophilum]|uniref:Large ribosomal subunit mL38-like protein n=1 Tax=Cladobotryum mycophilum TaxID=491253 RepID=A0ABR0SPB1_9HYPO
MSRCQAVARPLARHLRQQCATITTVRPFTTATPRAAEVQVQQTPPLTAPVPTSALDLDPNTVMPEFEPHLIKAGKMPIGSRRRRVAMRSTQNLPFEQLPYQAFQEARAILAADREAKLGKIREELEKIAALEQKSADDLASLRRYVERLKILADVNDPLVKKRFEDGLGDMNKPIYRYYAEKKWRSYDYRLITQRIKQFNIVPDVLPKLDPTIDVQLFFRTLKVPPGQVVDSLVSELLQEVPLPGGQHPPQTHGYLPAPQQDQVRRPARRPLAAPFAQKGSPYHRLGIYVLEQSPGQTIDVPTLTALYSARSHFSLKSFRDKFSLRPIGFNLFRSEWDESTASVMARHDIPGADVEFRPTRVHSLKPPVKPRGWEAKRQGPGFRHLWKYTKRIRGVSNGRGWTKKR